MNQELKKGNSIFFIELEKIEPNPYQPRVEFDQEKLNALADSIKQYGVLQPIVVSRKEEYSEEFGIRTKYQIIAGERRYRASKIAGLKSIPAIIREGEQTDAEKLELAIIENLQREDLNPVDKAKAFKKLADDFGLTHAEIAKKMGKSREYVSNAMRILMLPENMLNGLMNGNITEGHTRSLLMLKDRPNEQAELYRRILEDKLTVRAAEKIARSVATDKIRKKIDTDPEIKKIENHIREKLGTKVTIDQKPIGDGGRLTIEYFSKDDLRKILEIIDKNGEDEERVFVNNSDFYDETETSFDNIQPTILKEEIDKIEQFAEPKKMEVVEEKIINNFPEKEIIKNKNESIDGLERVEVKNDFDKSRIDSLKKTDGILKTFGAGFGFFGKNKKVEESELKKENENMLKKEDRDSYNETNESPSAETKISEDDNYSNLYEEFLKAKEEVSGDKENTESLDNSKIVGETEVILDAADNFSIRKKAPEPNANFITKPEALEEKEPEIQVEMVGGQVDDFLADAKAKPESQTKRQDDDVVNNDDDKDLYSFKGFSI